MTVDIHEIWTRISQGDAAAWRHLVDSFAGLVYGVARRVGLSVPDAEDCAQHTWLTLYRRRHTIRDPQSLPAWLIRTTHRQAVYISKRRSHTSSTPETGPEASQDILPDELVHRLERQALLECALDRLDPRCRRLLSALFLADEDVSYRRLAVELGLEPNSIGSMRTRCLKKLKQVLKEMGFERD